MHYMENALDKSHVKGFRHYLILQKSCCTTVLSLPYQFKVAFQRINVKSNTALKGAYF